MIFLTPCITPALMVTSRSRLRTNVDSPRNSIIAATFRVIARPSDIAWRDYLFAQGLVHVPVITFLDENFNELGAWMERPKIAAQYMDEWRNARPDFLAVRNSTDMDPQVRKERLAPYYAQLIQEMYT